MFLYFGSIDLSEIICFNTKFLSLYIKLFQPIQRTKINVIQLTNVKGIQNISTFIPCSEKFCCEKKQCAKSQKSQMKHLRLHARQIKFFLLICKFD